MARRHASFESFFVAIVAVKLLRGRDNLTGLTTKITTCLDDIGERETRCEVETDGFQY